MGRQLVMLVGRRVEARWLAGLAAAVMVLSLPGCTLWGRDQEEPVPETLCWGLSKADIEASAGHRLIHANESGATPPVLFDVYYQCYFDLEGIGSIRLSYNPEPRLAQVRTGLLTEAETREKWSQQRGFEQLDLGLGGGGYFLSRRVDETLEADAVWFAPDGRTLQVELLRSSSPEVTDEEGKRSVVSLLRYVASVYPSAFPTVQPRSAPSASVGSDPTAAPT
ncbi:hypothetical protein [Actinomyces trachealis]|uniref:hypothetical protein n=1 Tax=Actinomyces trachealis TaxID=2763540 RepID=UPI001892D1DF|nr:hypothetical protein [Actinomyces trachealis]